MPSTTTESHRVRTPLADRRRLLGLSQQQLADLTGLSASAVHRIETGKVRPRRLTATTLATVLAVTPEELFGE